MSTETTKNGEGGNEKVNHQEDRLSNLPNEILVKILSCLEIMEAGRSGILSTRWKSVWASVPVLDLNQSDFNFKGKRSDGDHKREEAKFLNFMEQVLIAPKVPCLEKVRIRGNNCDPYLLKSWMRAALERNAKELDVEFSSADSPCELTHNLFSRNKLVILKLRVNMTLNFLANPSVFPNLKVLQLDSILYTDEDSLPNLLSSCPILEDLFIIRGGKDNLGTLNLISRSVKSLKVYNRGIFFRKEGFVHNMMFDAPAVESLCIYCVKPKEILVKDLSRIVYARVDIFELRSFSVTYNLLRDISNVKYLRLDESTVQSIECSDAYDFPMFYNLICLEIYGDSRCEGDDRSDDKRAKILQWKLLLEILTCSPMLEHLIFGTNAQPAQECGKVSDWYVPNCLMSSVKTVEFNSFSESDVERVRYFLLNARVLEKMTIRYCYSASEDLKSELCNAIFENIKGSDTVVWSVKKVEVEKSDLTR